MVSIQFDPPNKCELCPYFSGVQCHGHGEYYGTCFILKALYGNLSYSCIVYEDTECLLKKYSKEELQAKNKVNF